MAKMSEQRMGEIALALLMLKLERDGGFRIGSGLRRELGDAAKTVGIPIYELEEFSKEILVRFIGKMYRMQKVSLEMSDPVKTHGDMT